MDTKEVIELGKDLEYLREEFEVENRLYANLDGYVMLDTIIKYCKENDHLLDHIIKVANKVDTLK